MAKNEQPPIYVMRRGSVLQPEMMEDKDLIERLPSGHRIKITVSEGRSPAKLRLYWSYLGRVVRATDCCPSPEALHSLVKLETGHTTPIRVKGYTVLVPASISFSSMSEAEFDDFLRAAERWLIETYGISITDAFTEAAA